MLRWDDPNLSALALSPVLLGLQCEIVSPTLYLPPICLCSIVNFHSDLCCFNIDS